MSLDITLVDSTTGATIPNGQAVQYSGQTVQQTLQMPTGELNIDIPSDPSVYYIFSAPGYGNIQDTGTDLLANGASSTAIYMTASTGFPKSTSLIVIGAGLLLLLMMKKKKKKAVSGIDDDIMPVVLIGGALLAFGGLNKILQALGIEKSAAATALLTSGSSVTSAWNPNFYKQYTSGILFDQPTADATATAIYDAFGFLNLGYDFDTIVAAIKTCQSQAEVSQVAASFNTQYNKDLYSFLYSGGLFASLTTDEMSQLTTYVSGLPTN